MRFKNRKELGNHGERIAELFLMKHGFRILTRNYRLFFGEIDIIAQKEGVIHFVEVKTVSQETVERGIRPEDHVTHEKISRIMKVAEFYLANNNLFEYPCQIDVVAIIKPKDPFHMEPIVSFFENVTRER